MGKLNQLKRARNALNNLRTDIRHMVSMETHHGMGNVLVRTYGALHQSVNEAINDPVVEALVVDVPDDADDRQKVTQVTVLAGQLLAIVEDYYEATQEDEPATGHLNEEEHINQRFNNLMDGE